MQPAFILVGDDRMMFSAEALEAVGLHSGERVASIAVLEALIAAEGAALEARRAVSRAHISSLLGGGTCK